MVEDEDLEREEPAQQPDGQGHAGHLQVVRVRQEIVEVDPAEQLVAERHGQEEPQPEEPSPAVAAQAAPRHHPGLDRQHEQQHVHAQQVRRGADGPELQVALAPPLHRSDRQMDGHDGEQGLQPGFHAHQRPADQRVAEGGHDRGE
jgi:hypothetical protein